MQQFGIYLVLTASEVLVIKLVCVTKHSKEYVLCPKIYFVATIEITRNIKTRLFYLFQM